jgi:hypothetical protein
MMQSTAALYNQPQQMDIINNFKNSNKSYNNSEKINTVNHNNPLSISIYEKNLETRDQEIICVTSNGKYMISVSIIDHIDEDESDSFLFVTSLTTQETLFRDWLQNKEVTGVVDFEI